MVEQELKQTVQSLLSRVEDLQDVTVCGAVDVGKRANGLASPEEPYDVAVVFVPDNPFQYAFLDGVDHSIPDVSTEKNGYNIRVKSENAFDVQSFAQAVKDEKNRPMQFLSSDSVFVDKMRLPQWRKRVSVEGNISEIANGYRKAAMDAYRDGVQRQILVDEPNKTGRTEYAVDDEESGEKRFYVYTPGKYDPEDYERVFPQSRVGADERAELVDAEQTIENQLEAWHGLLSAVYILDGQELPPSEFRTLIEDIRDISDDDWDRIPTDTLFNWSVKQQNGNGDEVVGNKHQRLIEDIETEVLNRMRKKKTKRVGVDKDHLNRLIQMTFKQAL